MINREAAIKYGKYNLQHDLYNLHSHLLKYRLSSRTLPWHCEEDEFDSALTGGYANYCNNRFPYVSVFSTRAKGGHLLAIGSEDGRITVLDTTELAEQDSKPKGKK